MLAVQDWSRVWQISFKMYYLYYDDIVSGNEAALNNNTTHTHRHKKKRKKRKGTDKRGILAPVLLIDKEEEKQSYSTCHL